MKSTRNLSLVKRLQRLEAARQKQVDTAGYRRQNLSGLKPGVPVRVSGLRAAVPLWTMQQVPGTYRL